MLQQPKVSILASLHGTMMRYPKRPCALIRHTPTYDATSHTSHCCRIFGSVGNLWKLYGESFFISSLQHAAAHLLPIFTWNNENMRWKQACRLYSRVFFDRLLSISMTSIICSNWRHHSLAGSARGREADDASVKESASFLLLNLNNSQLFRAVFIFCASWWVVQWIPHLYLKILQPFKQPLWYL